MAKWPCRSVPNMHTLACQTKPFLGFIDICFTCPPWCMDNHHIPCCKGAFCFSKCRDAGTLPKVQAVVAGPHGPLSPKTASESGPRPHLKVSHGCWIATLQRNCSEILFFLEIIELRDSNGHAFIHFLLPIMPLTILITGYLCCSRV